MPSKCTWQIPQTSSSGMSHRHVATAFHLRILTFIFDVYVQFKIGTATTKKLGHDIVLVDSWGTVNTLGVVSKDCFCCFCSAVLVVGRWCSCFHVRAWKLLSDRRMIPRTPYPNKQTNKSHFFTLWAFAGSATFSPSASPISKALYLYHEDHPSSTLYACPLPDSKRYLT